VRAAIDPRIFESNNLDPVAGSSTPSALYRDEAATDITTAAGVDALTDMTVSGTLSVDSMFVSAVDYHIQSGSMCVDAEKKREELMALNEMDGPVFKIRHDPRITRVGRFIKSYLPDLPWSDDLTYIQAQGYWILDNWLLFDITGEDQYAQCAVRGTQTVLSMQESEGWESTILHCCAPITSTFIK